MAPEVMEQKVGYDSQADVWSLGIAAIEVTEGNVPYSDLPPFKAMMLVLNQPSPSISKYMNWSPELRAFVDSCLQKDPQKRPKVSTILQKHKKFFDKSKGMKYIQENLLKDMPPIEERVTETTKQLGEEYFNLKY